MAKQKKQFRQLSDEELEKVTGGVKIEGPMVGNCMQINPNCKNKTKDEYGCLICISN